jgi:hypothetical protein
MKTNHGKNKPKFHLFEYIHMYISFFERGGWRGGWDENTANVETLLLHTSVHSIFVVL